MEPTAAPVLGFSHVNLLVDDLDAARAFYGHALSLDELPRPGIGGSGAWFRIGDLQLHLSAVDAMPTGAATSASHIALHLPSDAFDECVGAIEARGATLTRGPQSREQLGVPVRTAFCRDPAGNLIELTDAGPLS
jgi:catechol 2,3-dioxygenase-like lactoylglutathione lyase family enzyme